MARKLEEERIVQAMVEENIRLQLTHLRTHPAVAGRLALGKLQVQGWVYDIGRGKVSVFDEADSKFESLEEARLRMLRKDAR
jgi:carbonic anhydrase